jgi:hypothetical protein
MKFIFKSARTHRHCSRRGEQGYALMMLVFFTTLMLIAAMTVGPRILVEGKREKEKEMIWRGKQYARGVKLYYRKMGRFPTSLDDLTKPKTGSLRFMRQAYKDPMNATDGSWRFIYVGPAGQLIGSLKPPQTLQIPGAGPGLGTNVGALTGNGGQQQQSGGFGSSSFGQLGNNNAAAGQGNNAGFGLGNNTNSAFGSQPPTQTNPQNADPNNPQNGAPGNAQNGGQNPAQPGQPGAPTDGSQPAGTDASGATSADSGNPQPVTPTETPTIIGGNIIGVGSKIQEPSLIVYEKAKNYRLFEFIWDPSKDATIAGQPVQNGPGLGQNIGNNPSSFGTPGQQGNTNGSSFGQPNGSQGQNNPNTPNNNPSTPPLDGTPPPTPQQ